MDLSTYFIATKKSLHLKSNVVQPWEALRVTLKRNIEGTFDNRITCLPEQTNVQCGQQNKKTSSGSALKIGECNTEFARL